MLDALTISLDAAYAVRGVEVIYTPKSGTGPVALVGIVRATDKVANMLLAGAAVAGYRVRLRQRDLPTRPREGDVISISSEGIAMRVTLAQTSKLDGEWMLAATPVVAPVVVPQHGIGHLQPPLFGGWAWA